MRKRVKGFVALLLCFSLAVSFAPCSFAEDPEPSLLSAPPSQLRSSPIEWAGWIGEALANSFSDFIKGVTQTSAIPGSVPVWTTAYVSSGAMAQAVRDLPSYRELYGFNPLDHSTVIRSYDGGSQVSVLDPDGLYAAWLWLHDGNPPMDDVSTSDPVTDSSGTYLPLGNGTGNFAENGSFVPASDYVGRVYLVNGAANEGPYWFAMYGLASSSASYQNGGYNMFKSVASSASPIDFRVDGVRVYLDSESDIYIKTVYNGSGGTDRDVRFYVSTGGTNRGKSYSFIIASYQPTIRAYIYFSSSMVPPAPEPVAPVGPSQPDIEQPSVDSPQSDTPIQNTTTNITVTLPNGSTTVVEAPTVDILPIVHWLSIINANLVSWSKTIKDDIDGWGGNISDWLSQIWQTLDAFKQSVDNWSVSILAAIASLHLSSLINLDNWGTDALNLTDTILDNLPDGDYIMDRIGSGVDSLTGKFPFCLPWDLEAMLVLLKADPTTPVVDVPLPYLVGSVLQTETLHLDCSWLDGTAAVVRSLEYVGFCIGLVELTRRWCGVMMQHWKVS